ncbi:MAG: ATP-binding protein, partial [Proteobacteria bacterium]|nr:ATP-binding protein [Pseudomonadota bacterium]
MAFADVLTERFDQCIAVLGLSQCAARMLHIFVLADVDPKNAMARDRYGRQGVQAWDSVLDRLFDLGFALDEVEEAAEMLTNWNLIQLVGRAQSDPIVAGPAAMRLTAHGRTCVGLAPRRVLPSACAHDGWLILHGAHRERVHFAAAKMVGHVAWRPLSANVDPERMTWLCGSVAVALCSGSAVVVDAFGVTAEDRFEALRDLLLRTHIGHGPRVLAIADPMPIRMAAMVAPMGFQWVGPKAHTERDIDGVDMDDVVSKMLLQIEPKPSLADVCGVAGTGLAVPRKSETKWSSLIVSEQVQHQLDQMQLHARFRLEVLPLRVAFVGRGAGYRLLLSGIPGTGKSMASKALANSLNRPLVKLDLSSVLSKWLGETEQMIARIFEMSEASGSVLVLDEAEALFQQRQSGSSGSGAMSTAVAYLLTRLERYCGVLVATTNRTQDLDDAFFRRFDDFIVLPVPDTETRTRLWRVMLTAGAEPVDEEAIDIKVLARHFVLSGGLIRGAAIRAHSWVHYSGDALNMPVVLAAISRELEKNDQSNREVFMEPYGEAVAALL